MKALGRCLVVGLAVRVLWLSVRYLQHVPGVLRFQLESASVAFVVVGVALALWTRIPVGLTGDAPSPSLGLGLGWTWCVWCLAAFVLYWPALHMGFLSDDFVLVERAQHFRLGAFNPESFRPIPIVIWGAILHIGGGATSIHTLNIALHGTNAFLTSRLTRSRVVDWRAAIFAGALLLVSPLGPEAVAWNSGVFDLMASALVLAAIALGRGYGEGHASAGRRQILVCAAAAAFLCKETAVVVGPLIVLDAVVRRVRTRQLYIDAMAVTGAMVGVIGLRLALVSSAAKQPMTKYLVQRWLFGTFGSLVVPWHADVLRSHSWAPIAGVVAVVTLTTMIFVNRQSAERITLVAAGAGWALLATLPTITMLFVASDLQGSRYLYLASIGYAVSLTGAASTASRAPQILRRASVAALCLLLACGALGVRWHLRPWEEASAVRDQVIAARLALGSASGCQQLVLLDLPDNVRGAYVFRNGAEQALGVSPLPNDADVQRCSFRWDGQGFLSGRK